MSQNSVVKVRVGKRRTLVIPKRIAERLGIEEGSMLELSVVGDKLVLRPLPTALDLALHGRKYASVTIEELEEVSSEEQKRLAGV